MISCELAPLVPETLVGSSLRALGRSVLTVRAVLRVLGGTLLGALSGMLVAIPAAFLAEVLLIDDAALEAGTAGAFSLGLTALAFGVEAGGAAGLVIALMLEAARKGRFSKQALTVGSLATVGIWILYGLWTMQSLSSAGYPGAGFFWIVIVLGGLWTIMATLFVRAHVVRATARWWLRGALIGLVIGWMVGLVVVRPGPDDLLDTALDLVPTSAEVTHAAISGADFQLIDFTGPPSAWVEVTTDLTPEELTQDFERIASDEGWTVLPRIRHPGAMEIPLRSLLLTGKASSVVRGDDSGPLPGPDARINVRRHDWTGKVVTGTSSIAGALWVGILGWYMFGRVQEGDTQPQPLRWWHWVSLIVLAAIWLRGLAIIH